MSFGLPLEQLQTYRPERNEPADFDAFWTQALFEARQYPLQSSFEPVDVGLKLVDAFDVTFNGFGGRPIKGWLMLPRQRSGPLPCVAEYIGYGGGDAAGLLTGWCGVLRAMHILLWTRVVREVRGALAALPTLNPKAQTLRIQAL